MVTREALSWSLKRKADTSGGLHIALVANLPSSKRPDKVPSGRSGSGTVGFRFRNCFHPLNLKSPIGEARLIFHSQEELRQNGLRAPSRFEASSLLNG